MGTLSPSTRAGLGIALTIGIILIVLQFLASLPATTIPAITIPSWVFIGWGNIPFLLFLGAAIGVTLYAFRSSGWRMAAAAAMAIILWGLVLPAFPIWWSTLPFSASSGAGNAVSVGARCDNTLRTVLVSTTFQPIRAGCNVNWGIADVSPTSCVTLIDANSQPILTPACRGHEREFAGIPITGWKTAGGTALVDVIYQ